MGRRRYGLRTAPRVSRDTGESEVPVEWRRGAFRSLIHEEIDVAGLNIEFPAGSCLLSAIAADPHRRPIMSLTTAPRQRLPGIRDFRDAGWNPRSASRTALRWMWFLLLPAVRRVAIGVSRLNTAMMSTSLRGLKSCRGTYPKKVRSRIPGDTEPEFKSFPADCESR